jgi:hypothetical protein
MPIHSHIFVRANWGYRIEPADMANSIEGPFANVKNKSSLADRLSSESIRRTGAGLEAFPERKKATGSFR